jgi:hypothetical protein
MNKAFKIVLGIATLWPILYVVLFAVSALLFSDNEMPSDIWSNIFPIVLGAHFFTMALILALVIIYMIHVLKNDRIAKEAKALWVAVIFLGNMIAMPFYWYFHIWRKPEANTIGISSLES